MLHRLSTVKAPSIVPGMLPLQKLLDGGYAACQMSSLAGDLRNADLYGS
jgi:hypothetical protein